MIKIGDKEYRNLQEQVEKNKNDILFILQEEGVLNEFGIKVIGQEESTDDLPSVADYKEAHSDWAYGDAYAIGTEAPYELYVLTRANGTHPSDYWFNIGEFPMPGPQGEQGEQGIQGETGATGSTGATGAQGPQGPRGYSTRVISEELISTVGSYTEVTVENGIVHDIVISKNSNSNGIYGEVTSIDSYGNAMVKTLGSLRGPQGQQGIQGIQGPQGEQGPAGQDGADGADGIDGQDGVTPDITVEATVGSNVGTPTVTVTKSGTDASPTFTFAFDGVKGPQGETGQTGATGATGPVPVVSAVATVDSQVGTPTVTVTKSGTDASPTFTFAFSNIKGDTGTSLISVEVVSTLPASGTPGTLYFVPNGSASGTDLYNEYIWLNNSWELLGTASVDLSNYIQKSETSGLVKNDGTIDTNTYATVGQIPPVKVYSVSITDFTSQINFNNLANGEAEVIINYSDTADFTLISNMGIGSIVAINHGGSITQLYIISELVANNRVMLLIINTHLKFGTIVTTTNTAQTITGVKTFSSKVIASAGLSDGNNSTYNLQLPDTTSFTANKTLATTDQIPDTTSLVTTNTAQQIIGVKTFTQDALVVTGPFYGAGKIAINMTPQTAYVNDKNGYIKVNNATYGYKFPDGSSFTEDKTVATTDQIPTVPITGISVNSVAQTPVAGVVDITVPTPTSVPEVSYLTTAPSADNTSGNLKFVVLSSEPATYYNGYIYYITEA